MFLKNYPSYRNKGQNAQLDLFALVLEKNYMAHWIPWGQKHGCTCHFYDCRTSLYASTRSIILKNYPSYRNKGQNAQFDLFALVLEKIFMAHWIPWGQKHGCRCHFYDPRINIKVSIGLTFPIILPIIVNLVAMTLRPFRDVMSYNA